MVSIQLRLTVFSMLWLLVSSSCRYICGLNYQNSFPTGSNCKEAVCNARVGSLHSTWVRSPGGEDFLEKGMAAHSSILACRISWTEEPGRIQSMGSQRVRNNWGINTQQIYIYIHTHTYPHILKDFPGGDSCKEPACQCRRPKKHGINPCVGKIPWRRAWQPTPVLLPKESHRQRRLGDYSPLGHKETQLKWLSTNTHTFWKIPNSKYYECLIPGT